MGIAYCAINPWRGHELRRGWLVGRCESSPKTVLGADVGQSRYDHVPRVAVTAEVHIGGMGRISHSHLDLGAKGRVLPCDHAR